MGGRKRCNTSRSSRGGTYFDWSFCIGANAFWRVIALWSDQRRAEEGTKVTMASRYWAVSLPVHNSASQLWNQIQERISKHSFDTPLYRVIYILSLSLSLFFLSRFFIILNSRSQFNIPNLRVGTLDSLLSLGDDLAKVTQQSAEPLFFLWSRVSMRLTASSVIFSRTISWKESRTRSGARLRSSREFPAWTAAASPSMVSPWIPTWPGSLPFSCIACNQSLICDCSCLFQSHSFIFVLFYWFRFVWDEAKYPTMSPLKEIVDGIHSQVAKIEDDLKVC